MVKTSSQMPTWVTMVCSLQQQVIRNEIDDQTETGDALMARIAYNYNQRYFLTATIRRDGYSAFGQKNPRATSLLLVLHGLSVKKTS
jgi:outer membrane cobalamin receptor